MDFVPPLRATVRSRHEPLIKGEVVAISRVCIGLKEPAVDIGVRTKDGQTTYMGRWDFNQHWEVIPDFGKAFAFLHQYRVR